MPLVDHGSFPPALRRTLMAVEPRWASMSRRELALVEDRDEFIERLETEVDKDRPLLDDDDKAEYRWLCQLHLRGVGPHLFRYWEALPDGRLDEDFPLLSDLDRVVFAARTGGEPDAPDYKATLGFDVQCLRDGRVFFPDLRTFAEHVALEVHAGCRMKLSERVPHEFEERRGPDSFVGGVPVKSVSLELRADGRERLVLDARRRFEARTAELRDGLAVRMHGLGHRSAFVDGEGDMPTIVFSDASAVAAVRIDRFLEDLDALVARGDRIRECAATLTARAVEEFDAWLAAAADAFDPNVLPFPGRT